MATDPQTEALRRSTSAVAGATAVLAGRYLAETVRLDNLADTFELFTNRLVPLVRRGVDRTDALARVDYMATRAAARPTTRAPAWQSVPLDERRLRASLYATGFQSLQKVERLRRDPRRQLERAKAEVVGVAIRYTMNGARSSTIATTLRDDGAIGALYLNHPDGKACYFCTLLASRGPCYKGDSFAALEEQGKFEGTGTAKVHDNCRCVVKNVYAADIPLLDEARALFEEWKDVIYDSTRTRPIYHGDAAIQRWRKHREGRLGTTV